MKTKAKLLAMAAALAVLGGAWVLAESMAGEQTAREAAAVRSTPEHMDLSAGTAEDIRGMSWNFGGETISLVRDGESSVWVKQGDTDCPIDSEAVESLAAAAASVKARSSISHVMDYEQYGLAEPVLTLTVTTEDHAVTYDVGGRTLDGEYYIRVDGSDTVYTETGTLLPAFGVTLDELIAMETVPEDIGEVTGLSVATDVTAYELKYTKESSGQWSGGASKWFVTLGEETLPLEEKQAQMLCANVTEIEFLELVEWHGENPEAYGLDMPQGTATVTYTARDGGQRTFSLEFGDYTDGNVYVRMGGSPRVYTAVGSSLDGLMYPDWEAMAPLDIFPMDMTTVTGAEIRLGGHTYEVEIITGKTETPAENGEMHTEPVTCYVSNGWTLDTHDAQAWFGRLTDLKAESTAAEGEGREELLAVTLHRQDETMPEVTLTIWGYDSSRCLCAVDGEDWYFLSRTSAEALAAEAESFLIIE